MLSEELYDMGVLNGGNQHYSIYQKHYHHHTIKQPNIHETIFIYYNYLIIFQKYGYIQLSPQLFIPFEINYKYKLCVGHATIQKLYFVEPTILNINT